MTEVSKRLAGRRALVTGASRGIGRQRPNDSRRKVPTSPLRLGHLTGIPPCPVHYMTPPSVSASSAFVRSKLSPISPTWKSAPLLFRRAVDGLGGPIDILVNNAAAAIYQPLLDFPLKRRRLIFEVNVHAPMDLAQAVLPAMVDRKEGWIVNISSATAQLWDPPFKLGSLGTTTGVYGASKAALNRITNALAAEVAGTGLCVNTVEPRSAVMSEGAEVLIGGSLRADQVESMEEMVEAVVALCDCPPDRTGLNHVSLDLLDELGLTVRGLDGEVLGE